MDETLQLPLVSVRKLIGAGSADAALLYLYLQAGNNLTDAPTDLRLEQGQLDFATACLRQLGLLPSPARFLLPDDRPVYSEQDVLRELDRGKEFSLLVGETQRQLGRVLSTEDLKTLLSMIQYLGLSVDVIAILIHYCMDRSRARGNLRAPTLRSIEKEAYRWADNGIDTIEQAAAYVQTQLQQQEKVGQIRGFLQISDRRLTQQEEKYIHSWLDMGFDLPEIRLAYERTCLNTGGLKWQYMNKILQNWNEKGLHSLQLIQSETHPISGGRKPAVSPIGKAAIAKLMREEE